MDNQILILMAKLWLQDVITEIKEEKEAATND